MRTALIKAIEQLKNEIDDDPHATMFIESDKERESNVHSKTSSPHNINSNQKGNQKPNAKKIFVVHGRDEKLRHDFFQFLRAIGLNPIEWSEALSLTGEATPYIGKVLDAAFKHAQAVIVLLTPDDEVRLSPELCGKKEKSDETDLQLQARPNVLFEAGMAFGRNPKRTILVEVGDVKPFSDIAGRHVVRFTGSPEKRNELVMKLKTAECGVLTIGNDWLTVGDFSISRQIESKPSFNSPTELTKEDIQGYLSDWWSKNVSAPADIVVIFKTVDAAYNLLEGSTKNHIRTIAENNNYKIIISGKENATCRYDINCQDDFDLEPDPEPSY